MRPELTLTSPLRFPSLLDVRVNKQAVQWSRTFTRKMGFSHISLGKWLISESELPPQRLGLVKGLTAWRGSAMLEPLPSCGQTPQSLSVMIPDVGGGVRGPSCLPPCNGPISLTDTG